MEETVSRRNSIARRLSLIVGGTLVAAVLVVGSMALLEQRRQLTRALETKAASLAQFMAQVSPISILSLNFVEMNNNVKKVVLTDDEAVYAIIVNEKGIPLVYYLKDADPAVTGEARALWEKKSPLAAIGVMKQSARILEVEAPIRAGEKHIGSAMVGFSFDRMHHALMIQIALIGAILVVVTGASQFLLVLVLRRILQPVRALTSAATQISTGDLNVELAGTERRDELGVLSRAFGSMAAQLRGLIAGMEQRMAELQRMGQELRDSRQRLDNIIANSPSAIYRCANDPEWTMEFLSAAITRIAGYPADDFLNNRIRSYASIVHPDDRHIVRTAVLAGLERKDHYEMDYRLIARDGSPRWVHEQGRGVFAPDGRLLCLDGVIFDITDQRKAEAEIRKLNQELEQRVADRTAQLEAANKELEAFAYSVSHDLRTPLRAIDGFSHILLEDYAGKLDDEGRRLLNVVRDNANRMGQLIDDILMFSRTGRAELTFAEVDMEKLVHAVYEELQPSVSNSKLQLEIGHLPAMQGDRALIHQVFVNLLSNAIKFSHKQETPRIEVGAEVKGGEIVYFVKDNGAGFDMQFSGKLFGVFQRLHSANDFEGTGIGLAIVKRIIARHGGRVWAEGKVNEGATFFFSLPHAGIS